MNAIEKIWTDLNKLVPPTGEREGVDLTLLGSSSLSCVGTFLESGTLNTQQQQTLQRNLGQMRQLNPKLTGEHQLYFGLLYRVCEIVSEQLSGAFSD